MSWWQRMFASAKEEVKDRFPQPIKDDNDRWAEAWKQTCEVLDAHYKLGHAGLLLLPMSIESLRTLYGDPNKSTPKGVIDAKCKELQGGGDRGSGIPREPPS